MFRNKDYVLAVLKSGSFSKAAEEMYISQPSLSASIKRIEKKISSPIFNRTTPISLTEIGREYVRQALAIREIENDFSRYVTDHANLLTGTVKIGGSSLFSSYILPEMISKFSRQYPGIKFEITEDSTKELIQKLYAGILDIVIDNAVITDENISSHPCTSEILLLAVPKTFKINDFLEDVRLTAADIKLERHLHRKYTTNIENFSSEPFILLNPENDTGKRAKTILSKHNISPHIIFTLDQQVTAHNIASTGMGVAFVSDTLIKNLDINTTLYYYVLSDYEISRNIYFYNKSNHYLSSACKKFIDFNTD